MRKFLMLFFIIAALNGALYAQGILEPHLYMKEGVVEHHATTATVKADFGRPLEQAMTAVREEYGWVVDYEDPPYQGRHDVMDTTNPKYRATHPNAPVVLGPAGGAFQSTYPEPPNMWSSSAEEEAVLDKIVSDYNQNGNPGDFAVRQLSDGSFDIVGTSIYNDAGAAVPVTPVLDTPISVPSAARTMEGTFQAILGALSAKTGIKMNVGLGPWNIPSSAAFTVGGNGIPARDLLMQVMERFRGTMVWLFLYSPAQQPSQREYVLNVLPAMRAEYGTFGGKRLVPIAPRPAGSQ